MGFCVVTDLEDFLQETIPAERASAAERAISEATAAIVNYCKQAIALVEDEEITLDSAGGRRLFLPELPVIEVSSVVEDGETLTAGDDYKLAAHGILHRINNRWADGIQIVTIVYTHGYEEIPADVIAVCTRAASRAYQAGLRASAVGAVPGVVSYGLGDYSINFGAEGGGGVSEGVMGASAARMLLLSEKDTLDRYRIKRP